MTATKDRACVYEQLHTLVLYGMCPLPTNIQKLDDGISILDQSFPIEHRIHSWCYGSLKLHCFSFSALDSPKDKAGESEIPAGFTDHTLYPLVFQLPHSCLSIPSLEQTDIYPSRSADPSQNSLETPFPTASSKSNNLWPKTASQSQQECSQASTVVVYHGTGSRHSGALMENSPRAIYPRACHRPGTGEISQMLLHYYVCKLPGEPLKSLNSSSRKDY